MCSDRCSPSHVTTRTPSGSSWCARGTSTELKGKTSHGHSQQWMWRPDGRSRTQTPHGSKHTGPQHCPWEPHAPQQTTVGHRQVLIHLEGQASVFASHSGMKLEITNRKMEYSQVTGSQHNPRAQQSNHKGNDKIRRKTQEHAMDANFKRQISHHKNCYLESPWSCCVYKYQMVARWWCTLKWTCHVSSHPSKKTSNQSHLTH